MKPTKIELAAENYSDANWDGDYESMTSFIAGAEWMLKEMLKYFDEQRCYTNDDVIEYFNGNE